MCTVAAKNHLYAYLDYTYVELRTVMGTLAIPWPADDEYVVLVK